MLALASALAAMFWITSAEAAEPIVVLAPFNLTGSQAVLDAPCYKGAEIATDELNAAGGVLGRPIKLVPVDTASDTNTTTSVVGKALERHPHAVAGIGYAYSTDALKAGMAFQKAGIPFITPGATAPNLPEEVGSNMFLAAYGDDAQARVMAKYAWDELKVRHVTLWIDDSRVYTRTVGRYFDKFFRGLGGTVDKQDFGAEVKDFGDMIAAVKATDPQSQAIYAASMPESAVPLIEQVRDAGIRMPLLSADGWDDDQIVDASKNKNINNLYFTTHRFLGVDTPNMKAFIEAYKHKFGSPPPNAFAPLGFDSVNLLASAIEHAGSTKPEAIQAALAKTRGFQGLVGTIGYAPGKRVPDKAVEVIKVDDGVETPIWTWTPPSQ